MEIERVSTTASSNQRLETILLLVSKNSIYTNAKNSSNSDAKNCIVVSSGTDDTSDLPSIAYHKGYATLDLKYELLADI
ncbi:hypothetical protein L2E82_19441 [Cichorium intybus]|uniref:Uncharacterized protein n=1 Tax=Cichorium intybus TaxID=13427 RepID=A0ACB9FD43_CICIN|nr:hypothetical protein L2E82_19441 [Cichorium intybus]